MGPRAAGGRCSGRLDRQAPLPGCERAPTGFDHQLNPMHIAGGIGQVWGSVRDPLPRRKERAHARVRGRAPGRATTPATTAARPTRVRVAGGPRPRTAAAVGAVRRPRRATPSVDRSGGVSSLYDPGRCRGPCTRSTATNDTRGWRRTRRCSSGSIPRTPTRSASAVPRPTTGWSATWITTSAGSSGHWTLRAARRHARHLHDRPRRHRRQPRAVGQERRCTRRARASR